MFLFCRADISSLSQVFKPNNKSSVISSLLIEDLGSSPFSVVSVLCQGELSLIYSVSVILRHCESPRAIRVCSLGAHCSKKHCWRLLREQQNYRIHWGQPKTSDEVSLRFGRRSWQLCLCDHCLCFPEVLKELEHLDVEGISRCLTLQECCCMRRAQHRGA